MLTCQGHCQCNMGVSQRQGNLVPCWNSQCRPAIVPYFWKTSISHCLEKYLSQHIIFRHTYLFGSLETDLLPRMLACHYHPGNIELIVPKQMGYFTQQRLFGFFRDWFTLPNASLSTSSWKQGQNLDTISAHIDCYHRVYFCTTMFIWFFRDCFAPPNAGLSTSSSTQKQSQSFWRVFLSSRLFLYINVYLVL